MSSFNRARAHSHDPGRYVARYGCAADGVRDRSSALRGTRMPIQRSRWRCACDGALQIPRRCRSPQRADDVGLHLGEGSWCGARSQRPCRRRPPKLRGHCYLWVNIEGAPVSHQKQRRRAVFRNAGVVGENCRGRTRCLAGARYLPIDLHQDGPCWNDHTGTGGCRETRKHTQNPAYTCAVSKR